MAEESRTQLLADMKSFRSKTDLSDLTLKCGSDTYRVHKIVVASRAGVFAKALTFPGKEASDGLIDLSENESDIVKLLVQYLYEAEYDPVIAAPSPKSGVIAAQTTPHSCTNPNGNYCDGWERFCQVCPHHYCGNECSYSCIDFMCAKCTAETITGEAEQLLVHSKMYEMADKYDVSGLKKLCIGKYTLACLKFWDDAKFPESAYHIYSTTPTRDKGLRNVVCKTISSHMNLLKKPEVEDVMTEFNGLAFGLLFDKAEQAGWCK